MLKVLLIVAAVAVVVSAKKGIFKLNYPLLKLYLMKELNFLFIIYATSTDLFKL